MVLLLFYLTTTTVLHHYTATLPLLYLYCTTVLGLLC